MRKTHYTDRFVTESFVNIHEDYIVTEGIPMRLPEETERLERIIKQLTRD